MAKIAIELQQALARRRMNGASAHPTSRVLAAGEGWSVEDVICTAGAHDRPFEERHALFRIAIVAAGSFRYRSASGRELMTPGSLLLGNADHAFECGHEHGSGDRCISFGYTPEYFERLFAGAGARGSALAFRRVRLPPLRDLSPLVAQACAGVVGSGASWEELSVKLAAATIQLSNGEAPQRRDPPPGAAARIARIIRAIEGQSEASLPLGKLARAAGLSPYHFLRTFERVAGVTPHQYVVRTRLREAAMRLATENVKVIDIALDCGFGDVSNFTRTFRAEFGLSPRAYRRHVRPREPKARHPH